MNKQAILHFSYDQYGYQTDDKDFKVIIRTAKDDIKEIKLYWGDPYNWFPNKPGEKYHSSNGIGQHWEEQKVVVMQKQDATDLFDFYSFRFKNKEGRYLYFFEIMGKNHEKLFYTQYGLKKKNQINIMHSYGFNYNYSTIGKTNMIPKWFSKTNWYQIFPDSFNIENGKSLQSKNDIDSISGGSIKGIIEKLDYIQVLGFEGVYLCPILDSPSNHKYDTRDYYKIDKSFGTIEDFKLLIKELHSRKMKIMFDAVFNHSGSEWAPWLDVLKNKENSKYKDWFKINDFNNLKKPHEYDLKEFKKNKFYETFADTPFMPRLNWQNKNLRNELLKITKFWTNLQIDAWRLDVADEVSYDFWRDFRKVVRSVNSNVAIVGEIWYNSSPWLRGDIFDSTMNYIFRDAILDHFVYKNSIAEFRKKLVEMKYMYNYEVNNNLLNLIGSHDVSRFASLVNHTQKFEIAYALTILQKGTYSMYYGDEYELKNHKIKQQRHFINWKVNLSPNKFLINVMQFRKENNASFLKEIHYPINDVLEMSLDKFTIFVNSTDQNIKLKSLIKGFDLLENKNVQLATFEPFTLKIIKK